MDYDFIVGFTLFYPSGFKTRYTHFDNLKVAEMFCENKNLKNNSKIYVDYDYFKENHKEIIAKCSELWKNKIKAIIEELQEDIKYSANPLSIDNSKFAIKILQSLLEKE